MLVLLVALSAVLAGPPDQAQSQSLGAAEGLRPLPQQTEPARDQAAAAAPQSAPAPEAEAAPRTVCRMVQVTGTRFPIRQCRNAQQSEAERAESREMLRRMQGSRTEPVG